MKSLFFSILVFSSLSLAESADHKGIHIEPAVALDFTFPIDLTDSKDNKVTIRSAEVMFNAEIAPNFLGHLNFAFHDYHGTTEADVHEAYVVAHNLLPNLKLKVGKFLLGVGILNSVHQHDWLFTSTPKVQSEFFDSEAVSDSGFELTYNLPTELGWELKLGSTNGYTYGHTHEEGQRPKFPTSYIHLTNFLDIGAEGLVQWGLNHLYRNDHDHNEFHLTGLDFQWQDNRSHNPNHIISSEVWYRSVKQKNHNAAYDHSDPDHNHDHDHDHDHGHDHAHEAASTHYNDGNQIGLYIYGQTTLKDKHALGLRADHFEYLDGHNHDGAKITASEYSFTPSYIYSLNDTSRIRLSYTYTNVENTDIGNDSHQKIALQWVVIIGAHNHQH